MDSKTLVFYNTYRTYAGSLAIIPELFMQLLQQDNLKFNIAKYDTNTIIDENDENNENNETVRKNKSENNNETIRKNQSENSYEIVELYNNDLK